MRPRGTYGPVAKALIDAAGEAPGQVRELCARAGVGYSAGRYTAARLVDAGALVVLNAGRPAVLASAGGGTTAHEPLQRLAAALRPCPRMVVFNSTDC